MPFLVYTNFEDASVKSPLNFSVRVISVGDSSESNAYPNLITALYFFSK